MRAAPSVPPLAPAPLTGCGGALCYTQPPEASYSVYADYFWYELGDVVCIGTGELSYYCFPRDNTPVAKVRLAVEELYRRSPRVIEKNSRKSEK